MSRQSLLLTLVLGLLVLGFLMLRGRRAAPDDQLRVDGGWVTDSTGARFIAGVVTNESDQPYGHLHITFSLLDADSQVVGTAAASTQGLAAGERWEFRTRVEDTLAVHFRVEGLSSIGAGPQP